MKTVILLCAMIFNNRPKAAVFQSAKQLWTPKVGLTTGATRWMQAGGGHHTMLSFTLKQEQIADLCEMLGVNAEIIA